MNHEELRERIDLQLERLDLRRRARRAVVIGFAAASVGVLGALDGGKADANANEDASYDCQSEDCVAIPMYGVDSVGCSAMKVPW